MKNLKVKTNQQVKVKFQDYPENIKSKLNYLRKLIIETADQIEDITELEETLKWGEPSYIVKKGSTIRIDWKEKTPDQYAIYFQCTSRLVPTFKILYKNKFNFEGNRAIIFSLEDNIPAEELKKCFIAALTYHKVKHLPTLGI
ncbi:MAG: hypothetical protein CR986_02945 [Ignavibacteriae bacterium]|nr:MAG: hypothetical protein CR986_02945 [Ignavibacteriota bacterium]